VTICHNASKNNPHTITVAQPAVKAHLAHGDTLGECQSIATTTTSSDTVPVKKVPPGQVKKSKK